MTTTRTALVTGANRGIGKEIARQLGALGYTVVLGARDEVRGREAADELVAEGIDARAVQLDVTDPDSVDKAVLALDRLDVLVNNAAVIVDGDGEAVGATADVLTRTYATNVVGVANVTTAVLPLLRSSPAGRIVNLSSELGSLARIGDPQSRAHAIRMVAYNSSKTAVNALTVAFANELRGTGVLVNAADPGNCATQMGGADAPRTAQQGAAVAVRLATLPDDGPTGELHDEDGQLPW
jgi:NAD(P)-dependent dehydrogenase (short-subunit alcohol dehydrogenase family)